MATSSVDLVTSTAMPPLTHVPRDAHSLMPVMQIADAIERRNIVNGFVKQVMVPDLDFGVIPGTEKPTLLKPGAEKLCSLFGLVPRYEFVERTENWGDEYGQGVFFYYLYRCSLYRGDIFMGEADGSCNSHESKYRYRWVQENDVPSGLDRKRLKMRGGRISEFEFAIEKAQTAGQYGKPQEYWDQFKRAIADGTARKVDKDLRNGGSKPGWEIDATLYRVPNPDVADQANSILKIAAKRAFIAAALVATNASEKFTQDLDDMTDDALSGMTDGVIPPVTTTSASGTHGGGEYRNQNDPRKDQVRVVGPDGEFGSVSPADLDSYLARGFRMAPPTPQSTPTQTATSAAPQADLPPYVADLYRAMKDTPSAQKIIAGLRDDLKELMGGDVSERFYLGLISQPEIWDSAKSNFKTLRSARTVARQMLEAKMEAESAPPPEDAPPPADENAASGEQYPYGK